MKIAIIGKGKVGKALGAGLERTGHEVKYGHRDPEEPVDQAARWGDLVIVAVPCTQLANVAREIGNNADGKTLIDVTNPIGKDGQMAVGCTTSAAEELQKMVPRAKVIKAFNTVFAKNQSDGKLGGKALTAFIAGDDAGAKKTIEDITQRMGYEPVDCGGLKCARFLEPMGMQIISLAFDQGLGTGIGYRMVRE